MGVPPLRLFAAVVLGVAPWRACAQGSLADLPFYHTGDQIREHLSELTKNCGHASLSVTTKSDGGNGSVALDVYTLRPKGGASFLQRGSARVRAGDAGPLKAMIVFGEHPRELISAESGMTLLSALCGGSTGNSTSFLQLQDGAAAAALGSLDELKVIVNANPLARKEVEGGDWCRRTNEDKVDLNRNYGEHFDPTVELAETNPGPEGFSEPETRVIRDVAQEFGPHLFLTVHSGALLLGTPYGFQPQTPPTDKESKMVNVLAPISAKYCECPYGSLSQIIGYKAPGNAIDYAYEDLDIPFSFTWEIYADKDLTDYYHWSRKSQAQAQALGVDGPVAKAATDPSDVLAFAFGKAEGSMQDDWAHLTDRARGGLGDGGTFLETGATDSQTLRYRQLKKALARSAGEDTGRDGNCLANFNPTDQGAYEATLSKWTSAYFDLFQAVSQQV